MHYSERMRSVWLILEWLPCTTVREWGVSGWSWSGCHALHSERMSERMSGWSWSGCHALQWENEESLADLGVVAMHYSERMRSVWLILEWLPCTTVREWGVSGWSWSGCHALQWENEESLADLGVVAMHYSERMRRVWLILEWLPCTTVREWGVSGDLGMFAMHYSERMRSVWLILEWLPCTTVREWGVSGWSWSGCHALQWENEESLADLGVVAMHYVWLILEWLPCTTVREWGVSGWSWSGCHALQWENEECLADLGVVAMHYSERMRRVWLILEWLPCTTVREWGVWLSGWSWKWLPCTTVREWGESGWSWSGCHALQWENEESLADLGVVAMHYSERMRSVWLILEWLPCTTVREWGESGWSWSGCHALQWENEELSGHDLGMFAMHYSERMRSLVVWPWSWSGCHAL